VNAPLNPEFNKAASLPIDSAPAAGKLLARARTAVAEMKKELAESKALITDLMGLSKEADKDAREKMKSAYIAGFKTRVISGMNTLDQADLMERMYGLYKRMFPIESEREQLSKLLKVLQHNDDLALQAEGAPFKQQWVVVENQQGEIVAARYFSTFSTVNEPNAPAGIDGTQHLTYSFVDPKYRSLGLGEHTMKTAEAEGRAFIAATHGAGRSPESVNLLQFCEQNAPLKMTAAEFLTDTAGAKTDQFWRRDYYEKMGFRSIEHAYIQVPLRKRENGGVSVHFLDLLVRAKTASPMDMAQIPAATVAFHIYNTAKRSFAAQQYDVDAEADWLKQLRSLSAQDKLEIHPRLDFMSMKDKVWNKIDDSIKSPAFSADDFNGKPLGEAFGLAEIPAYIPDASKSPAKSAAPRAPV
jgi:GNAT superfamily N-acetyltransferase